MRTKPNPALVETAIPARLDRLRWGRFHTLVVVALGITWILDGLEVTLAGAVAGALKESPTLNLTNAEVGLASSFYLAGAVLGALLFGWLTDRLGRKRLFVITLTVYLLATAATAFSWDFLSFALFRFLTGAGIGGEYTAIASTIQEFVPARYRGWTALIINGSFWIGAALGAGGSIVLLDPALLPPDLGYRYRRHWSAMAVWRPDRHRLAGKPVRRVSLGGGPNARCSAYRISVRHCRGAQAARSGGHAVVSSQLNCSSRLDALGGTPPMGNVRLWHLADMDHNAEHVRS